MPFRFDKEIRKKAFEADTELVGFHVTSPYRNKGSDFQLEAHCFSREQASSLIYLMTMFISKPELIQKAVEGVK